ncbi:hypothetical protein MLP_19480 [Microlunatus phosphovorus NM-1]|uniref:Uncharacterized protein n=1 Tax=Microlunatus phosphovorus (strain ATCC 700054 / DSM 10555 / JCM 9379 / NBRC 101784 / NCIMB 13414 / VKM Ac-1990 / NM-1) TaxID=1032480 RepID=F5XT90_MICPN|nr:hypothetical protein MLP_19480 [Microlunatus phosphovorus NM-1]
MVADSGPHLSDLGRAFRLDPEVLQILRDGLPQVATHTVNAVVAEVPDYRGARDGLMRDTITGAVRMALAGFLKLAGRGHDVDPSTPMGPTIEGAYALGRGEARGGRSMDGLLAAYRVGSRVSWRELGRVAAGAGLSATMMAEFAELLFAYIDGLSAASVAGHNDELTTSGLVRQRYRDRLVQRLLAGASPEVLTAAAERAGWSPSVGLTAVLLPSAQAHGVVALLGTETLQFAEDLPGSEGWDPDRSLTLLLVPDATAADRRHLLRLLVGRKAVVGPSRPWMQARSSYRRATRTLELATPPRGEQPTDSEDHLADLVVGADPEALIDLRVQVLRPLSALPESTRERLAETLLSWLLHQGRREQVAAELHIHPQTVRYRMGQLRDAYGERLHDPRFVRELILALPLCCRH